MSANEKKKPDQPSSRKLPPEVEQGFSDHQIQHVACEIDHDVRNEDWDDETKGWDKVRWNNRAMAMAIVAFNKKQDEVDALHKYITEELSCHLPDCWWRRNKDHPCTCPRNNKKES